MAYDIQKEMIEAINAGEKALCSLREAQRNLDSAGNWGIVDIFGGGFISNLMKHSKIDDAKRCMETARQDLRAFQKELDDIDGVLPDIDIGGFLK